MRRSNLQVQQKKADKHNKAALLLLYTKNCYTATAKFGNTKKVLYFAA